MLPCLPGKINTLIYFKKQSEIFYRIIKKLLILVFFVL